MCRPAFVRPLVLAWAILGLQSAVHPLQAAGLSAEAILRELDCRCGIAALVDDREASLAMELARRSELLVYLQLDNEEDTAAARRALEDAGLLNRRVYVEHGPKSRIHLADQLADAVIACAAQTPREAELELLRVLRPGGKAWIAGKVVTKSQPDGVDAWSHPYHGPDNNPLSTDSQAKAPYRSQFLAEPYYVPLPAVTVAAGGRVFKAFGHVGFKEREWPWLNTLAAFNGYNGVVLWRRGLTEGFNIHRNTMIADEYTLYLADDVSCKLFDAASGKPAGEIVAPPEASGKVWKWMALCGDVLYAMTGAEEYRDATLRGKKTSAGWPWRPMTEGYDREEASWARGATFFATELPTKRVLWRQDEPQPVDGRAVCMADGKLFFYSDRRYLACRDARTGGELWNSADRELLEAIGEHTKNQIWHRGFSTQSYLMYADGVLLFAGPQRTNLVAASADRGKLLWQRPDGNVQLVARPEGLYALGGAPDLYPRSSTKLLNPRTGEVLADLEYHRGNCTRATGTIDSVFCRVHGNRGTMRLNVADRTLQRFAVMRPDCHGGVIAANGLLYWGPWMCDCNLSLVGFMGLGPAPRVAADRSGDAADRLEPAVDRSKHAASPVDDPLGAPLPGDWPTYRADNRRSSSAPLEIARQIKPMWQLPARSINEPTAPVTCRGRLFVAGGDGAVACYTTDDGKPLWKTCTGGAVFFPPTEHAGRVYVGSGDGYLYAFRRESGELDWRFRAAPIQRKIPVYGRLMSTWPVASGVLADRGVLYAAAGIASYDGTHVYSLDAKTGRLRWHNDACGQLAPGQGNPGVSVQGHLLLEGDVLYLAGGSAVSPAMFDAGSGRCLNEVADPLCTAPRGRDLFLVGDRVVAYDRILYSPKQYWQGHFYTGPLCQAYGNGVTVRGGEQYVARIDPASASRWTRDLWHTEVPPKRLWQSDCFELAQAVVLGKDAAVFAGRMKTEAGVSEPCYAMAAFANSDGSLLWTEPLPAMPVSFGLATDAAGRLLVTTEDGRILCFGKK
ncbi:MAG: PQQ-binding-like beta-propeller repeat protein [Pirellulales bacterium]|nr:PQQ-binding-like beta-propeller repeat protein [Pirellulales bacterium]